MNRLLPPPGARERGQTMILAAIMTPVVVGTAALGIGAAMVRSADSEVQRAAHLSALAAAATAPMLGRPTASGVPSVPTSLDESGEVPLPPAAKNPPSASLYTAGSIYQSQYSASTQADRDISAKVHAGPITQPALASLGSGWTQGCDVAQAQFEAGRAKLGRNYAAERDGAGNPVVPHCATNGIFADGSAQGQQHVYIRPEMESTGAYRLERCLQRPGDCTSQLGRSEQSALSSIGSQYSTLLYQKLGISPSSGCLIDPTGAGCAYNATPAANLMGASASAAVQGAFRSAFPSIAGISYANLPTVKADLQTLGGLLFGKTLLDNACSTALGPASGQTLCSAGVNMASTLPSTLTPRIRSIVHHAVDFPFVPSITGAKVGDFSFVEQALARRSYKNAVVVPTLPANFSASYGSDTSACLRGVPYLPNAASSAGFVLGQTLSAFNTALSAFVSLINSGNSTCGNAEVDSAANGSFTLDLNPTLGQSQTALIGAASALNGVTNEATNTVIASAIGRSPSECTTKPMAAWCVDVGGQAIRDAQDVYNPPSGNSAPTAGDVMQRAYQNGEDVQIIALGKTVTIPLGVSPLSPAGPVSALTFWIPAFDVVPATVTSYDPNHPELTKVKVSGQPHGLYKGVLLDPAADLYPLCTETPSTVGACFDQPPA